MVRCIVFNLQIGTNDLESKVQLGSWVNCILSLNLTLSMTSDMENMPSCTLASELVGDLATTGGNRGVAAAAIEVTYLEA